MKIRLKMTTPAGDTALFEHAGPVVRIGRDPSCELVLEGDAGTAASRQHACIELSPTSARLIDTDSANGTLHNTKSIDEPVPLRPGDRIQIGHTGTSLVVVDLDLAPAAPPRGKPAGDRRLLLAAGGGLAALVVLGAALLFWPRRQPEEIAQRPEETKQKTPEPPEPPKPLEPLPPPLPLPPPPIKVGHCLRPTDRRASVLLQRAGENHPWCVHRSGQAVHTEHTLVSLPGYASQVYLDCGLRLNLWGHLPDFDPEFDPKDDPKIKREARAPVRESVVLLNKPPEGVGADLVLDRGRVEMECVAPTARCVVRLRFLGEVWDITLAAPGSKVCVELWSRPPVGSGPALCLGLFSQGKVTVKPDRRPTLEFSSPARVAWASWQPQGVFREELAAPPDWWVKPPKLTPRVEDALLSLEDWATKPKRLDESPDVVDTLLTVARDPSNDPTDRKLGVWFLAALEETSHLFEFLEDQARDHGEVRNTAMLGLQDWLLRNGPRQSTLVRQAQRRRGYSSSKASLIVGLLAPLPPKAYADAKTYEKLIGHLQHENTAVRHLADWHLCNAPLPEGMRKQAKEIGYDPMMDEDKRPQAVAQLRKLLPGRVPPRPRERKGPEKK